MSTGRSVPVRTCVGCRSRVAKTELLRTVVIDGVLVPDPHGRQPGRGASVHPTLGCVDLAERRRAFSRAFRLSASLDMSMLRSHVEAVTAQHRLRGTSESADGEHRFENGS